MRLVAISPKGELAACATPQAVRLLDLVTQEEIDRIDLGASGEDARGLVFTPGGMLLVGTTRGVVLRFEVSAR